MFAHPKKPIVPNYKVSECDHSLTTSLKPLLSKIREHLSFGSAVADSPNVQANDNLHAKDTGVRFAERVERASPPVQRTGDGMSYTFNANNGAFYGKKQARRMFRVMICKENPETGEKTLIDSLDGKVYSKGFKFANRQISNVVLYDSKEAALSERFPSNQAYAGRGGNARYARILIAFEAWGNFRRRLGGGSSFHCDHAVAMNVLECLDPLQPMAGRLCERYVAPYFHTKAETNPTPPTRERSSEHFRKNRIFVKD